MLALFALTSAGCMRACTHKKTDEVRVREKVDALPVHLYVAAKVALLRSSSSPELRQLRDDMVGLGRFGERLLRSTTQEIPGAPANDPSAPVPAPAPSSTSEPAHIGPTEVARAAASLWRLRGEASRMVRAEGTDGLAPVLPSLFGTALQPELAAALDANTEHALLLTLEFLLRMDERVPVPIPPEIILYEAWRTDAGTARLPGMTDVLRSVKSVVYAEHDLCDLAAREAAQISERADSAALSAQLSQTASLLTYGAVNSRLTPERARAVSVASRALAHGSTGVCYMARLDDARATSELRLFVAAAHEAGVAREQTALVRAYLALSANDRDAALAALAEARRNPAAAPEDQEAITALDAAIRAGGGVGAARTMLRVRVGVLAARVLYRSLDESGMFSAIRDSEAGRSLAGFIAAMRALVSRPLSVNVPLPGGASGGGGGAGRSGHHRSHHWF